MEEEVTTPVWTPSESHRWTGRRLRLFISPALANTLSACFSSDRVRDTTLCLPLENDQFSPSFESNSSHRIS